MIRKSMWWIPSPLSLREAGIALKAMELEGAGSVLEEIVKRLEDFRDEMNTYFVLNNLETLRKKRCRLTGGRRWWLPLSI